MLLTNWPKYLRQIDNKKRAIPYTKQRYHPMVTRMGDPLEAVGSILATTLSKTGMRSIAVLLQISQRWPHIVGERIAKNAAPTHLSRGILTLQVASSAWQNELTFMQKKLIAKINDGFSQSVVLQIRAVPSVAPKASLLATPPHKLAYTTVQNPAEDSQGGNDNLTSVQKRQNPEKKIVTEQDIAAAFQRIFVAAHQTSFPQPKRS